VDREQKSGFILRWARELALHLERSETQLNEEGLLADDFSSTVSLDFEDGSRVHFRYAFFVRNLYEPERVAICTEHCGYYEFWVGPDDSLTLQ
jgi:hypothetical protein